MENKLAEVKKEVNTFTYQKTTLKGIFVEENVTLIDDVMINI